MLKPEIVVHTNGADQHIGGGADRYSNAVKWHIDEARALHIVGVGGNVGAYAPGCWVSVRFVE